MENITALEVRMGQRRVGRLLLRADGICLFEYAAEWLSCGFSISPFELPLKSGVFEAKRSPFGGGFGVFDDSMPDGWGLLIMDRHLQCLGIRPEELNLLDRLALVGSCGRGALEFYPDKSFSNSMDFVDFEKLQKEVSAILRNDGDTGEDCIAELYRRGGSPGGARPKVFVRYDGDEWLVKFPAREDADRIGSQEYNYHLLARRCGVEMMDCRLFDNKFFGTKRFDRTSDGRKIHVISMAGLLCADYRIPSLDYYHIFQVTANLTHCVNELWKVFKLMCFNYLIGNKDDHAKNFAFLYENEEWHLAPAFDILPSTGIGGYHTTSFNNAINPTDQNLLTLARKFSLPDKDAREVLENMRCQVKQMGKIIL